MAKPASGILLDGAQDLTTGLGVCIPFNEGSGVPHSVSTSGVTAFSVTGTLTWGTDGTSGGYLQGDGSTGFATHSFASIDSATSFTIAAWVDLPATDTVYACLIEKGVNTEFQFQSLNSGASYACLFGLSNIGGLSSGPSIVGTGWHFMHVTFASGTAHIYFDGTDISGPVTCTFAGGTDPLYLFGVASGDGYESKARLAGVWIWKNRVLDGTEITSHIADPWQMFVVAGPPTTATLSGPTSGMVGVASTNFTVTLDQPAGVGGVSCVITDSVGGDTITPT